MNNYNAGIRELLKYKDEITREEALQSALVDDVRKLTGYSPRPLQQKLKQNLRRFSALVCHRRFGKTVFCINELIEAAWELTIDEGNYAYVAPTRKDAKRIAWKYLKNFTEKLPARQVSEGELYVEFDNRHGKRMRIQLYGADKDRESMRGSYFDGVVFDETPLIAPSVWTQQVRPALSDDVREVYDYTLRRNQWCIFIGTPKGRNWFYHMVSRAMKWAAGGYIEEVTEDGLRIPRYSTDWYGEILPASATGILTKRELEAARLDIMLNSKSGLDPDAEYKQEYECSFEAAIRGSIYGRVLDEIAREGRFTDIPFVPSVPVHTSWDLGWDDMTAIWFFQCIGQETRFLRYYEGSGADLAHYAKVMLDYQHKYGYVYGKNLLPHDVEVHELGTGKTRATILRENGVRVTTVKQHKVQDGIAATRRWLRTSWFDTLGTSEGTDHLRLYRREYDENHEVFRENPVHDGASHAADALRGGAMGLTAAMQSDTPHSGNVIRHKLGEQIRQTHAEM